MAKYINADCRLCRREGTKLFLKGERCTAKKCALERRVGAPGMHPTTRKKPSEYLIQLREKQKVKRAYGLLEKQFRMVYERAVQMRGKTSEIMLCLLERRLDNVVYRLGLGSSRAQARQIVNHRHITVNGKIVNIPSYTVNAGDVIAVKESSANKKMFEGVKGSRVIVPKWLEFEPTKLTGKVATLPSRDDIDLTIAEHLIIELYSK